MSDNKQELPFAEVIKNLFTDLEYAKNTPNLPSSLSLKWFADNQEKYKDVYKIEKRSKSHSYYLETTIQQDKKGCIDNNQPHIYHPYTKGSDGNFSIRYDEFHNTILETPITVLSSIDGSSVTIDRFYTDRFGKTDYTQGKRFTEKRGYFGMKRTYFPSFTRKHSFVVRKHVGYFLAPIDDRGNTKGVGVMLDLNYVFHNDGSPFNCFGAIVEVIKGFGEGMEKKNNKVKQAQEVIEVIERINKL